MIDLKSNEMLLASNVSADKKYQESFLNLYKYLNSSVISINECLNNALGEAYAKAKLIKEGALA
jgi:hypothetical protein